MKQAKLSLSKADAEKLYKAGHISEKSFSALCSGGYVKMADGGAVPTEEEVEAQIAKEEQGAPVQPQVQAVAQVPIDESQAYRNALAQDLKPVTDRVVPQGAWEGLKQNLGALLPGSGESVQPTEGSTEQVSSAGPTPAAYDGKPSIPAAQGDLASDQAAPQANVYQQAGAQLMSQGMQGMDAAFNRQAKGIQGMADAQAGQAKATAEALHGARVELENMGKVSAIQEERRQSAYDSQIKTMQQVADQFSKQSVDPNRVFKNMSTAGKAFTLVGLALGGKASPEMLNNLINRDIDAQKTDIAVKGKSFEIQNNLFHALREKGMDEQQATLAAKSLMLDRVETMVKETAAKFGSPIAQSNAQAALAHLDQERAQIKLQMGQNIMNMSQFQGTPLAAISKLQDPQIKKMALEEYKGQAESTKQIQQVQKDFATVGKLQSTAEWVKNPVQTKSRIDALNLGIMEIAKPLFGRVNEMELNQLLKNNKIGLFDNEKTRQLKLNTILSFYKNHNPTPTLDAMGLSQKTLDLKPNE